MQASLPPFRWLSLLAIALPMICSLPVRAEEKFDSTISVLDENNQIVRSGPASVNSQMIEVSVGPGRAFIPNASTIVAGDTVRWTFIDAGHTVTSGPPCTIDDVYCSPSNVNCSVVGTQNSGTTFTHTFAAAGTYHYFCRIHCGSGMTGTITVLAPFAAVTGVSHGLDGHFIFQGNTIPDRQVTIEATPNLVSQFMSIATVTANASGAFQFDDVSQTVPPRFYRAVFQ